MLWKCLYLWLQSLSCLWTPGHSWAWRCPWNHQATRGHWGLNKSYIPRGPSKWKSNQRVTWWFWKYGEHLNVEMKSNNIYYKLDFYFFISSKQNICNSWIKDYFRIKLIVCKNSSSKSNSNWYWNSMGWVIFCQTLSLTLV